MVFGVNTRSWPEIDGPFLVRGQQAVVGVQQPTLNSAPDPPIVTGDGPVTRRPAI